ncbi:MAG: hypothetical protein GX201_10605 [Clostridiales bacterium]|nr:hypothetical protein [Clostridiales bacterium]
MTIGKITESILKDLAKDIDETVNMGILYDDKVLLAGKNDLELMSYFRNNKYEKRTEKYCYYTKKLKEKVNTINDILIKMKYEYEYSHLV